MHWVEKMEKQNASAMRSSSLVTECFACSCKLCYWARRTTGAPHGCRSFWVETAGPGVGQDVAVGQQAGTSYRQPPSLEAIRSSLDISKAVTRLLSYYDEQAEMEVLQGKGPYGCRKSGRYNVTDTTNVKPEFKWPNEGYITNSSVMKPAYDDMSMVQWVAGQLHNISQVEDP